MGYGDDSMALVVRERFELLENDGRPVRIKVVRRLVGEDDAMSPKKSAGNNESARWSARSRRPNSSRAMSTDDGLKLGCILAANSKFSRAVSAWNKNGS